MALMFSEDKNDLVITCKCGCNEGIHLHIDHKSDQDYYAYQCFTNGKYFIECNGVLDTLKNKICKIWSIICNKDYYYTDVIMDKEEFDTLKKWINKF